MDRIAWRYWLATQCEQSPTYSDAAGELLESWRQFAKGKGTEPGTSAEFADAMEGLGFTCDRLAGERNRIRWGVRLKRQPKPLGGG